MLKTKLKNILISNPAKLNKLVAAFKHGGANKIHVLADFDKTLTQAYANGQYVNSLISILRDEKYLTPDYPEKSYALFNRYYPLEQNHRLARAKKKRLMNEWWTKHFQLLIKSGLTKADIARAVRSKNMLLRSGALEFFKVLKAKNIPLVIMSASGLGDEAVKAHLHHTQNHTNNIHIISNILTWNKQGYMTGYKKPIITSVNKDETVVKNFPLVMKKIKNRTNVLLLGDQLEDLHMITGFAYKHLIKIGFYNHKDKNNLTLYKKKFDIIILNDSPMDYTNALLKEIVSS